MIQKTWLSTLVFLIVASALGAAFAKEQRTFDLDEIVVTGTKTEKTVFDSPVSVSVISSEDIEQSPVMTVDEAMQCTPGSFHWKRTGMTEPPSFS